LHLIPPLLTLVLAQLVAGGLLPDSFHKDSSFFMTACHRDVSKHLPVQAASKDVKLLTPESQCHLAHAC